MILSSFKRFAPIALLTGCIILSGCSTTNPPGKTNGNPQGGSGTSSVQEADNIKGGTDSDGFVRLPGEPTRQDKSYYVVEDICAQFTQKFMEGVISKPIIRVQGPIVSGLSNCSYYISDKEYVMLVLDYLSVEKQKKALEYLGRTVITDPRVSMEHMIAKGKDGTIDTAYFILGPNKFITLQRSSPRALTEDEVTSLIIALANKMKEFK